MKSTSLLFVIISSCSAFTTHNNVFNSKSATPQCSNRLPSTSLSMANDKDLLRWARSARSAGANDRVVELKRPLGIVLDVDDSGNVYVETVAPRGNAARSGKVKEGDTVVMCSATFGDQLWSTRGVGLTRVLSAIKVRSGPTVTLVLENSKESGKKVVESSKAAEVAEEARERAQGKKDQLMKQLEKDEKKLNKGKFFGLF